MEWILTIYLFFGEAEIKQVGPFKNQILCEQALKQHNEAIFETHYRNKLKKKKKYAAKCMRSR
jgi:hypothetical protein